MEKGWTEIVPIITQPCSTHISQIASSDLYGILGE